MQTRLELLAIAIERFRLSEDALPNVLDELVPAYIDEVPRDSFSGLPLKYIPSAEGYSVYSIGMNQIDEGGVDSKKYMEGDIVLRVAR